MWMFEEEVQHKGVKRKLSEVFNETKAPPTSCVDDSHAGMLICRAQVIKFTYIYIYR